MAVKRAILFMVLMVACIPLNRYMFRLVGHFEIVAGGAQKIPDYWPEYRVRQQTVDCTPVHEYHGHLWWRKADVSYTDCLAYGTRSENKEIGHFETKSQGGKYLVTFIWQCINCKQTPVKDMKVWDGNIDLPMSETLHSGVKLNDGDLLIITYALKSDGKAQVPWLN